jgi:hypothetical protein
MHRHARRHCARAKTGWGLPPARVCAARWVDGSQAFRQQSHGAHLLHPQRPYAEVLAAAGAPEIETAVGLQAPGRALRYPMGELSGLSGQVWVYAGRPERGEGADRSDVVCRRVVVRRLAA